MKEFLNSKTGSAIVLAIFFGFVYYMNRSWFQDGFFSFFLAFFMAFSMAFFMAFFYITDYFVDKKNRNPKYIHYHLFPKKISNQLKIFLSENYPFYNKLQPYYKLSFEHRVAKFLRRYQIISRGNLEINEEMKTIIAGSYVQLTFGMNTYLTYKFNKILVYPNSYISSISKQEHIGEYNPQLQLIVFSWKDFLEGLKIENDCYNLGIHEFTHAVLDEARTNYGDDGKSTSFNDFENGFDEIQKLLKSSDYYKKLKDSNFFRNYAFTNNEEFISVIMEYFFESPTEFQVNFPNLFSIVKKMLNYQESWFQN